jgi:hypothetical protein
MVHTKAALNYLKPDESITGGAVPLYLANNIFKLEEGDKLKQEELYGINGFTIKLTMIKSRSNRAGQEGWFVYDQVHGIDNALSNLLYIKNNKILEGAGIGLHLPDSDVKFRLSTFKQKIKENKDLRIAFKKLIISNYRKLVNKNEDEETDSSEKEEVTKTVKKKTTTKKKTSKK